jgi:EF-P beta-lysylation protein EpmB
MIPITDLTWQGLSQQELSEGSSSWQSLVSSAIRDAKTLADALGLAPVEVETDFPINVPMPYLARIERGNPSDPLLLQVLARPEEQNASGEVSPLQEEHFGRGLGMIQKYEGRALVITTGSCAIHCRYCFRRHFPYQANQPSTEDWQNLFLRLKAEDSLSEVILSGGDPLMLSDRRLHWIIEQLGEVPHLATLRLHTRLPVVIPSRVTTQLLQSLSRSRLNIVLVTHINHANEIDSEVISATKQLQSAGVTLLNQSVLLRQINDSVGALADLSQQLINAGILPYYLHLMDPVKGAAHFDVSEASGVELISQLRARMPGYLVPRLSREVPFESSKRVIA